MQFSSAAPAAPAVVAAAKAAMEINDLHRCRWASRAIPEHPGDAVACQGAAAAVVEVALRSTGARRAGCGFGPKRGRLAKASCQDSHRSARTEVRVGATGRSSGPG